MDIDFSRWITPKQETYEIWMMDIYDETGYINIGWYRQGSHPTIEGALSFAEQRVKAMFGHDTVAYGKYEIKLDEDGNPEPVPIQVAYRIVKRVVTEEVVSTKVDSRGERCSHVQS